MLTKKKLEAFVKEKCVTFTYTKCYHIYTIMPSIYCASQRIPILNVNVINNV